MRLRFSVFGREDTFLKAMRRIRPSFQLLLDAFDSVQVQDQTFEAILAGITDDQGTDFFEEVPNDDGVFQVLAGCSADVSDRVLKRQVFDILRRAVSSCPLPEEDHGACDAVFSQFESVVED